MNFVHIKLQIFCLFVFILGTRFVVENDGTHYTQQDRGLSNWALGRGPSGPPKKCLVILWYHGVSGESLCVFKYVGPVFYDLTNSSVLPDSKGRLH